MFPLKDCIPDRLISSEVQYETLLGFKSDCSWSCDTEWQVLSTVDFGDSVLEESSATGSAHSENEITEHYYVLEEVQYETLLGFKSDCSGSSDTECQVLSTVNSGDSIFEELSATTSAHSQNEINALIYFRR